MVSRRRNLGFACRRRATAAETIAIPLGMASSKPWAVPETRIVQAAAVAFGGGFLPLDAVYEILLRLPAKLLCRLRVVCRLWRSLLSDLQFAAAHAARHPGPLVIAGYDQNAGDGTLVNIMDMSGQIVKQVRRIDGSDKVMSMDLDLVCVKNVDSGRYRFLNPATGAVYHLPSFFADEHMCLSFNLVGDPKYILGQVPGTGEYKVLRIFYHLSRVLHCQLFEICTLNSGSNSRWRRKEAPGETVAFCKFTRLVIDEIVYLICSGLHRFITCHDQVFEKDMIITFNLETEAWGPRIRGPPISFLNDAAQMFHNFGLPKTKQLSLANLHGSLAVVHGPAPYMDFWILMDIDKGQWVKQYSMQFEQYGHLKYVHPLLVLGDGRIVVHQEDTGFLQIYDPRTNSFTNSVELNHYSAVNMYTGNLLSLDK
ncbi:unnamed protein product [Urochloa decumbens]|uniref:F-box domain-containing protein n=1 Tax=Urochloa decumbens TaxID=240449 RepID=A0ABC9FLI1_9POAL